MYYLIPLALLAILFLPLFVKYRNMATGKNTGHAKRALLINLSAFALMCLVTVILPFGGIASAASTGATTGSGLGFIAAALSTGLACIGGGIAVAQGATAAIGAVSEDPKIFGRAMIFVVLGEGIAIYGLIISIMIISRL